MLVDKLKKVSPNKAKLALIIFCIQTLIPNKHLFYDRSILLLSRGLDSAELPMAFLLIKVFLGVIVQVFWYWNICLNS